MSCFSQEVTSYCCTDSTRHVFCHRVATVPCSTFFSVFHPLACSYFQHRWACMILLWWEKCQNTNNEIINYEERLTVLGLFILERQYLGKDMRQIYEIIHGVERADGESCYSQSTSSWRYLMNLMENHGRQIYQWLLNSTSKDNQSLNLRARRYLQEKVSTYIPCR